MGCILHNVCSVHCALCTVHCKEHLAVIVRGAGWWMLMMTNVRSSWNLLFYGRLYEAPPVGAHCAVVASSFVGTEQGLALVVLHNIIQALRLESTRHVPTSGDETNERTGNAEHEEAILILPSVVVQLLNTHILPLHVKLISNNHSPKLKYLKHCLWPG